MAISSVRSRLLVAMTRTSTFTRFEPPSRSKVWSCRARTILPWVSTGMSDTSSSSSVPPCARSSTPARRGLATESLPASTPNSSSSKRAGLSVAQLSTTNGPSARRDRLWIIRATTSLPEPAAPLISTREPVGDTRSTLARNWTMAWLSPVSVVSGPARRRSSAFSRASAAACSARRTISSSRSDWNGFSMKS